MAIRRFEYTNNKKLTALKSDSVNNAIWIAFSIDSDNNVIIERKSAFEPDQNFFTLTRSIDQVTDMDIDSTNLYVSYADDTLLGEIISITNPLTITTTIDIPVGITETPVAVRIDGSDLYFLLPGNTSGENAKILKFNDDGDFIETID